MMGERTDEAWRCAPGCHEVLGWTNVRQEDRGSSRVVVYTFQCRACGGTWDEDYVGGRYVNQSAGPGVSTS